MLDITQPDYEAVVMAFDYGDVRVGVALKPAEQASAEALITIPNNPQMWGIIKDLLSQYSPSQVVVGRPRNLEGENTKQTNKAELFASKLSSSYNIDIQLQDEALTTEQAKQRIPSRISSRTRDIIDQYAACIILESFLQEKQT
ncbi:MAG: Holliday junction resolvase RuvX [Patescibacteria group bacterium]|jgi:putative Holliday junction resolvase|nr:Holliday junction resolvase RuvX [Patescibacteria group bacterium]